METIFGQTKEVYIEQKRRLEAELYDAELPQHRRWEIESLLYYIETILKEFEKRERR
jgi:hypothetical protein